MAIVDDAAFEVVLVVGELERSQTVIYFSLPMDNINWGLRLSAAL